MPEAQILVARQGRVVQIRVIGRATFKISRELREYGISMIHQGAGNLIVDLSSCQGMDSTFMGVLAMIGLAARRENAVVTMVNAGEHHRRLLDGIGISRLFQFTDEEVPEVTWQSLCRAAAGAAAPGPVADTIVEAHRTLMQVTPENVPRFKDVVEMLTGETGLAEKNVNKEESSR